MAWIESHQTLSAHPKTRKFAHVLCVSKACAIGHLHMFWWWALDYAQDGNLDTFDDLDIAIGAEWEGDSSEFVSAMVAVGFIDENTDGSRHIHDWDDYAGKLIDRRKRNAERMKEARAQEAAERAEHVQSTQHARVKLPNPTQPNHTQPNQLSTDRFDTWYTAYPNKVGRKRAEQAFAKIDWRKVDFDAVMAALENHKQSDQWTKDGGKFIPHPATWLNGERWNDELKPARTGSVSEPQGYSSDPDEAEAQLRNHLKLLGETG